MSATATVADLAAEQAELRAVLDGIGATDWLRPTPAWSWDVRDTIAHLADTDDIAVDTMTGGPRSLGLVRESSTSSEDTTYRGVLRGRRMTGAHVGAWWAEASARERDTIAALDPDTRVPWGLGMKVPSFIAARIMETWAHGLDVHAALGVEPVDSDRLAFVAWLATRALAYAYTVAGREAPPGALRVELVLPSGAPWTFGAEDADGVISGPAGQYCRVFTQRLRLADAPELKASGEVAESALAVARAYL